MNTPTKQQQIDMDLAYAETFGEEPTGLCQYPWRAVPINRDWTDTSFFNLSAEPIDLPLLSNRTKHGKRMYATANDLPLVF